MASNGKDSILRTPREFVGATRLRHSPSRQGGVQRPRAPEVIDGILPRAVCPERNFRIGTPEWEVRARSPHPGGRASHAAFFAASWRQAARIAQMLPPFRGSKARRIACTCASDKTRRLDGVACSRPRAPSQSWDPTHHGPVPVRGEVSPLRASKGHGGAVLCIRKISSQRKGCGVMRRTRWPCALMPARGLHGASRRSWLARAVKAPNGGTGPFHGRKGVQFLPGWRCARTRCALIAGSTPSQRGKGSAEITTRGACTRWSGERQVKAGFNREDRPRYATPCGPLSCSTMRK